MSLLENENIIIISKAPGTYVKGHYIEGAITYTRTIANPQPLEDKELQQLKEGQRTKVSLKFYCEIAILENNFIRIVSENIKKVVTCTVDVVLDSTDYTCTINETIFTYNSGIGATALSIVDGIVNEILNGSELVDPSDNLDGSYTITSNIEGTDFSIEVDSNQSFILDVDNVKMEYKCIQSKDYTKHGLDHYKAICLLVERQNGL